MAFDWMYFVLLFVMVMVGIHTFCRPLYLCPLVFALTVWTVVSTVLAWREGLDKVPIWWDVHGVPCLWAPPWLGYLLVPLLAFVVSNALLLAIGSNLSSHGEKSKGALLNIISLPACFLLNIQCDILMSASNPRDDKFPVGLFATQAVTLYLILGALITNVEPNRVIGIITPWTNDSNWKALHQKAGCVFILYSVVVGTPVMWFDPVGWPMLLAMLVFFLGPWIICWGIAYSYHFSNSGTDPELATPLCPESASEV